MHLMSIESVSVSYPEKPVLSDVSFGIAAGQRVGVIGRNGSGKSTLLRVVAGIQAPDTGRVIRASGVTVSALDQDPAFPPQTTVGSVVGADRASIALADRLGLADPDARAATLSGGQRKRLALAVTLAADADLVILDEPTNHLDVDVIEWLEGHLLERSSALLLVTHDRYLLDRVVNRVIEVHDTRLIPHHGTYDQYLGARATREENDAMAAHRLKQRLRIEMEWLRRSPKARTSKSRARVKQVETMAARPQAAPRSELSLDLPSRRLGSKVVNLHSAGKAYDGRWVVRGVTHKLQPDARIGVVGPNGSGKTTLLSLIAGRLAPDEGKVTWGATVVPGWYGQEPRELDPHRRLIGVVRDEAEIIQLESGIASATQLLQRFLFNRSAQQALIGDLSGGERRRLELLLTLMHAPNLLLLDEPTNDLDLDTLAVLEEYLDEWKGALVVASHDRYFLDRVCGDIFSMESDGSVRHHPGGWTAYRDSRTPIAQTARPLAPPRRRPRPAPTRLTYMDQFELDELGDLIPELERQRAELGALLDEAGADYQRATDLGARLAEVMADLEVAEDRWLALQARADELS